MSRQNHQLVVGATLFAISRRVEAAVAGLAAPERALVDVLRHRCLLAELGPGDTLYIPIGWWHAVRGGEGANFSLNYWYAQQL